MFLVIDPAALGGGTVYHARVETLIAAMLEDPGVRLPGERRRALAAQAEATGVMLPDSLLAQLRSLAAAT